jgi:hypothetical protein
MNDVHYLVLLILTVSRWKGGVQRNAKRTDWVAGN